jgi:long-chain acyl-CoA synthetase
MAIETIAGIVRTHGRERPDVVAIRMGDRQVTYGELDRASSRVANALAAEGVGAQDHVTFLDKSSIEHFEVQFGAAKVNAISVDVNWRLAPPEIAHIVNDADTKVLVVGQEYAGVLDQIADQLATVKKVVVIGGHPGYESYEDWRDRQPDTDPGVESGPDDVCLQLYSSGTTGLPKGAMLTNENLLALMPQACDIWFFSPESVNLVAMPLFHIGGGGWALVGLYQGCPMVLVRELDPAALVRLIAEERVTHAFIVPALLQFMLMVPGVQDADFSSLELILYGASPISLRVLTDAVRTFGCRFVQAYGLTETTGAIVSLPAEDHDPEGPNAHRLRSAGKPNLGVEIRVVAVDTGEDVPLGEVGEIWCRTVQNMKGYWNLPEETAKALPGDGWFRTGDAGYLDADGYLYIHDRVKDMIVSGGENIYPAELENVLMSHPGVADVAVIGVPSERWGETPKALVVRADNAEGGAVSEAELIAYCRERLASYKCPTSVEWIDTLPRNPSGKILKKDLRAPYWEGRDRLVG